ncbi:MAG: extracellular solute-binding protein [FCB group bacterium]|nr:extracellular solute-binding protein [FCB group bacterium]
MRRQIVSGVCIAMAMSVAAFAEEPVTLYYWGNEYDLQIYPLVRDFEFLHQGRIKVIAGQSGSVNKTDDPQRLLCAVAGGDPPDVVFFDRFAVGEWASRGAFHCLQDLYDRDLREKPDDPFTLHRDQFFTPCWNEANFDGKLYAVPDDTDIRALYYNQDMLERRADELIAAGCVDPNDPAKVGPPRNWDQLKAATRILMERGPSGKLERVGFIPNSRFGNSWLYIYGWLNGATFMSPDGRTALLNSPEVVDALAYMTELYDIMGGAEAVNGFESSNTGVELDPFLSGRIAMMITGDAYLSTVMRFQRNMDYGVTLAPAPEGREPLGWSGGYCFVIPAGSKHPEEAYKLIKYLSSRRAYEIKNDIKKQLSATQGVPYLPYISARSDVTYWGVEHYVYSDPLLPQRYKDSMRLFVDSMPFAKYRPVTPVGQVYWNKQVWAMERGIYKRFDPDPKRNAQKALDLANADIQRELDRIYKATPLPTLSWTPILVSYLVLVLLMFVFVIWRFGRDTQARGYFRSEFYAGYLFAAPWFIGFLVFSGGPILFSLFMSFCNYDVFNPPKWVGLSNYIEMFTQMPISTNIFYKSLWNTVYMALAVPLGMAVGLGIAMLLNHEVKGMAIYRTFFYLPAIMPAVAASILWIWVFNPQAGILNSMLAWFGIHGPAWLQNETWSKPALIIMSLWGAGASMIVWLAGLKGIPTHLYEAAELDGAGPFRQFWNVTLPMLSPYILFNLIMGLIGTFQIFTQAYIMTRGGPVDSTLFYAYALFNYAFQYMRMGYASAMAWVLFAIVLVLTVLQLQLSKRWVHYGSEG